MVTEILAIIAGLTALGAVVSMLINILKMVGVIKDGDSERWVQVANLIVFLVVATLYILKTPVNWGGVNQLLEVIGVILGYLVQILGSKITYPLVKHTPVIGFTFSDKNKV